MITSRTLSTPVWVAASISSTSMSRPSAISMQASQTPHGSAVGPFTQLSARARMRARRGLAAAARAGEHERLGDAPALERVAQRPGHGLLAEHVIETLGTPLAGEDLVGHEGMESPVQFRTAGSHRGPEGLHTSRKRLALLPSGPDAVRGPEIAQVPGRGAARHRSAGGLLAQPHPPGERTSDQCNTAGVGAHLGAGMAASARTPSVDTFQQLTGASPIARKPTGWSPACCRARPPRAARSRGCARRRCAPRESSRGRAGAACPRPSGTECRWCRRRPRFRSRPGLEVHRRHLEHFVDRARAPTVAASTARSVVVRPRRCGR